LIRIRIKKTQDPHHSDKSDPDPHQGNANPQHWQHLKSWYWRNYWRALIKFKIFSPFSFEEIGSRKGSSGSLKKVQAHNMSLSSRLSHAKFLLNSLLLLVLQLFLLGWYSTGTVHNGRRIPINKYRLPQLYPYKKIQNRWTITKGLKVKFMFIVVRVHRVIENFLERTGRIKAIKNSVLISQKSFKKSVMIW
jgi:hypothetical protein